ncbi:EpsG family protein [Vibrio fluvialis]|nr:EpsG family protein [Vibrio fluvialis]
MLILFILAIPNILNKRSEVLDRTSLFILIIVLCGNFLNGVDWIHYYSRYQSYRYNSEIDGLMEPLFSFLMYTISKISYNYHYFVIVCNIIISINVYMAVKILTNRVSLAIFMIYLFYGLGFFNEQLRQAIAFSVVFWGLSELIVNGNKRKFILMVSIASLFHVSAVSAFLILLVKRVKINFLSVSIYLFLAVIVNFFLFLLLDIVVAYGLLPAFAIHKLNNYSDMLSGSRSSSFGLFMILDILWLYLFAGMNKLLNSKEKFLAKIGVLFCMLHIIFYAFPPLQRISIYFFIANLMLATEFLQVKTKKIKFIFVLTTVFYSFYYYYSYQVSSLSKGYMDNDVFYMMMFDQIDFNSLRYQRCSDISKVDPMFCFSTLN